MWLSKWTPPVTALSSFFLSPSTMSLMTAAHSVLGLPKVRTDITDVLKTVLEEYLKKKEKLLSKEHYKSLDERARQMTSTNMYKEVTEEI